MIRVANPPILFRIALVKKQNHLFLLYEINRNVLMQLAD